MEHRSPLRPNRPRNLALPRQRQILKRRQQPSVQYSIRQRFRYIVIANEAGCAGGAVKIDRNSELKKIVPECAGIQPCNMLHISRELTLQEVQPLERRFIDRYECRQ